MLPEKNYVHSSNTKTILPEKTTFCNFNPETILPENNYAHSFNTKTTLPEKNYVCSYYTKLMKRFQPKTICSLTPKNYTLARTKLPAFCSFFSLLFLTV